MILSHLRVCRSIPGIESIWVFPLGRSRRFNCFFGAGRHPHVRSLGIIHYNTIQNGPCSQRTEIEITTSNELRECKILIFVFGAGLFQVHPPIELDFLTNPHVTSLDETCHGRSWKSLKRCTVVTRGDLMPSPDEAIYGDLPMASLIWKMGPSEHPLRNRCLPKTNPSKDWKCSKPKKGSNIRLDCPSPTRNSLFPMCLNML